MWRGYLTIALFLLAGSAEAIEVPQGLDTCRSLSACLSLLDKVVPKRDDGEGSNSDVLAKDFLRFGEPAKQEFLRRAVGDNPGWRNVAGAILANWNSWNESDIPALRDALRKDRGGWVARPLGKIGTPDAIRALVEDLSTASDVENQTGFALKKLGAKAVPFLMPLLRDQEKSLLAAQVIAEMEPAPISFVRTWAATALDVQEPVAVRLAALRGIAALGPAAGHSSELLRVLLQDGNPELQKQVAATLRVVRDPIMVVEMAKSCQPKAAQFDFLALDAALCLREIADFGPAGRTAGGPLTPFLNSGNGAEQAYGILTLGFIDYDPAIPQIEEALDAKDWRVVYAAIRAAGWLGAKDAAAKLDKLASSYWLVELRGDAAQVVAALRSPQGRMKRETWDVMDRGIKRDPTWVITDGFRGNEQSCPEKQWQWQEEKLRIPLSRKPNAQSLRFWNGNVWGELVGTDHGEWGGDLTWIPAHGAPEVLDRDNVRALQYDDGGVIATFGLAHLGFNYGYALKVSRNAGGIWTQKEIARLPGEPQGWTRLKSNRIAVLTAGRVVVFSPKEGILGVASCVHR